MKLRHYLGWIAAALFMILGILIDLCLVGYRFTAYICVGIALLLVCCQLLRILSIHHKRTAAVLRILLSIFLCLGLLAAGATSLYIAKAAFSEPEQGCDYFILLGAGVHGSRPSLTLYDRLDAAYDYLIDNPETVCIVSGGQGSNENLSEAQCMYNELTRRGIDPIRIWMEDRATSTYENLVFSLDLIQAKTGQRPQTVGILSSEYHIFRACQVAQKIGIDPVGIPAKTYHPLLFLNYFLREIPAVWYYTVFGG